MRMQPLIGRKATAVLWAVSGLLFAAYPALRPFSSELGRAGAEAFASPLWLIAHISAIAAFAAVVLAAAGTYSRPPCRPAAARTAWLLHTIGICLILPFYGAEAYGLHALGQAAAAGPEPLTSMLVGLASDVRGGVGLVVALTGFAAIAAGSVVGVAATDPMTVRRWAAVVFALAAVLLVPQFFADQPLRTLHGILYLAGCLMFTAALLREERTTAPARRLATAGPGDS